MASYPQRSGLGFIVALRLMREQLAHGFLSSSIYRFFKTIYLPFSPHNAWNAIQQLGLTRAADRRHPAAGKIERFENVANPCLTASQAATRRQKT
jgi:hypothetical protein